MARKEKGLTDLNSEAGFNSPFAGLAGLRGALPAAPSPEPAADRSASEPSAPRIAPPARAVVRLVRKGRGGKEATEVSHLSLDAPTLESWLRELKGQLGCGGSLEGEVLVLHGDQRERLMELLAQRGVRKLTRG